MDHLPEGFIKVQDSRLIYIMSYATSQNFLGRPVTGYEAPVCILSTPVATALSQVQDTLDQQGEGYALVIYDGYRPQRAVEDFKKWALDLEDQSQKDLYYPFAHKSDLFNLGYISQRSSHSRGAAVDLTLARRSPSGQVEVLDMGTPFDFFHTSSHTADPSIVGVPQKNRQFLKGLMESHGFENYHKEWWHYSYKAEPFPHTYFDFVVR
jgi:D-alanyl-D-alanine dipeptidase